MILEFLVGQIIQGKITYQQIISRRPGLEKKLDEYLQNKKIQIDKNKSNII